MTFKLGTGRSFENAAFRGEGGSAKLEPSMVLSQAERPRPPLQPGSWSLLDGAGRELTEARPVLGEAEPAAQGLWKPLTAAR